MSSKERHFYDGHGIVGAQVTILISLLKKRAPTRTCVERQKICPFTR